MRVQIKRYGAVALAGIMAGSFALTGCGSYASSSELRLQAEASLSGQADSGNGTGQDSRREPGSGTQDGQGGQDGQDSQGAQDGQGIRTGGPSAETIRVETGLTTAPMPEFEPVNDEVYVKTEDGGSVRLRSSCSTDSDSNIVTYASPGTRLARTGKGSEWTRIDYNGSTAYLSSAYITTEVPKTTAAPGNMRSFPKSTQGRPSCTVQRQGPGRTLQSVSTPATAPRAVRQ